MTNNSIAFDFSEEVESPTRVYTEMMAHMIFDVKTDSGFMRKAIFVVHLNTSISNLESD